MGTNLSPHTFAIHCIINWIYKGLLLPHISFCSYFKNNISKSKFTQPVGFDLILLNVLRPLFCVLALGQTGSMRMMMTQLVGGGNFNIPKENLFGAYIGTKELHVCAWQEKIYSNNIHQWVWKWHISWVFYKFIEPSIFGLAIFNSRCTNKYKSNPLTLLNYAVRLRYESNERHWPTTKPEYIPYHV